PTYNDTSIRMEAPTYDNDLSDSTNIQRLQQHIALVKAKYSK
ncbi:8571_t:CDS:1, partial [Gigaspora margarita]